MYFITPNKTIKDDITNFTNDSKSKLTKYLYDDIVYMITIRQYHYILNLKMLQLYYFVQLIMYYTFLEKYYYFQYEF